MLPVTLLRSAKRRADAVFRVAGPGRLEDPAVRAVQSARAVLGAAVSVALMVRYGTEQDWGGVLGDSAVRLFVAPWLLLVTGPLVIGGFILYAPSRHRPLLRSRLRGPLKQAAVYVAALFVLAGLIALWTADPTDELGRVSAVEQLLPWLLVAPVLWLVAFLVFASVAVARHAFSTADVHAVLPALLTVVLVWELALVGMVSGGLSQGPWWVRLCSLFGGPLSVTAVAWWEVRRLRTRYGVVVRGDPPE